MKIVVLVIASLFLMTAQPSFAKEARADSHHLGGTAASASKSASGTGIKTGAQTDTNSADAKPGDDIGLTALPLRSALTSDKSVVAKPSSKITKPGNFPASRPGLSTPVARNAIGQPLTPAANPTGDGQRLGSAAKPQAEGFDVTRTAAPGEGVGESNVRRQIFHPLESVSNPGRGKIDGAGLSRPATPSGLGGPAKSLAGINGTTVRPKH